MLNLFRFNDLLMWLLGWTCRGIETRRPSKNAKSRRMWQGRCSRGVETQSPLWECHKSYVAGEITPGGRHPVAPLKATLAHFSFCPNTESYVSGGINNEGASARSSCSTLTVTKKISVNAPFRSTRPCPFFQTPSRALRKHLSHDLYVSWTATSS